MLLHASRAAGRLTKLSGLAGGLLSMAGKAAKGAGGLIVRHPLPALGVGLTAATTLPVAAKGLRQAKAGLTPEYAQYSQNRGVPALPKI